LDIESGSIPVAPTPEMRNGDHSNMEQLFSDSTLTEREKELIYRAYLAGIAQSGATPPTSASASSSGKGSGNKIKFKRERKNKSSSGGSPVQWDFNSEGPSTGYVVNIFTFIYFLKLKLKSSCRIMLTLLCFVLWCFQACFREFVSA
jgi:hypothetical protein